MSAGGPQALKAAKYLKLKMIKKKYGFTQRTGIGAKGLNRYIDLALQIGQTGHVSGHIAERKISVRYRPLQRWIFLSSSS